MDRGSPGPRSVQAAAVARQAVPSTRPDRSECRVIPVFATTRRNTAEKRAWPLLFFIFVELLLRHNTKTQAHHEREDCSRLSHYRVGQQRHSEVRVSCRTSFSARQVASPCRTQKGRRGSEKHLAGCASVAPGVAQVRVV